MTLHVLVQLIEEWLPFLDFEALLGEEGVHPLAKATIDISVTCLPDACVQVCNQLVPWPLSLDPVLDLLQCLVSVSHLLDDLTHTGNDHGLLIDYNLQRHRQRELLFHSVQIDLLVQEHLVHLDTILALDIQSPGRVELIGEILQVVILQL